MNIKWTAGSELVRSSSNEGIRHSSFVNWYQPADSLLNPHPPAVKIPFRRNANLRGSAQRTDWESLFSMRHSVFVNYRLQFYSQTLIHLQSTREERAVEYRGLQPKWTRIPVAWLRVTFGKAYVLANSTLVPNTSREKTPKSQFRISNLNKGATRKNSKRQLAQSSFQKRRCTANWDCHKANLITENFNR